jgi:hypothetical protein
MQIGYFISFAEMAPYMRHRFIPRPCKNTPPGGRIFDFLFTRLFVSFYSQSMAEHNANDPTNGLLAPLSSRSLMRQTRARFVIALSGPVAYYSCASIAAGRMLRLDFKLANILAGYRRPMLASRQLLIRDSKTLSLKNRIGQLTPSKCSSCHTNLIANRA